MVRRESRVVGAAEGARSRGRNVVLELSTRKGLVVPTLERGMPNGPPRRFCLHAATDIESACRVGSAPAHGRLPALCGGVHVSPERRPSRRSQRLGVQRRHARGGSRMHPARDRPPARPARLDPDGDGRGRLGDRRHDLDVHRRERPQRAVPVDRRHRLPRGVPPGVRRDHAAAALARRHAARQPLAGRRDRRPRRRSTRYSGRLPGRAEHDRRLTGRGRDEPRLSPRGRHADRARRLGARGHRLAAGPHVGASSPPACSSSRSATASTSTRPRPGHMLRKPDRPRLDRRRTCCSPGRRGSRDASARRPGWTAGDSSSPPSPSASSRSACSSTTTGSGSTRCRSRSRAWRSWR